MAKKILVVDDDEDIRTTLRFILEDEGYGVDTVENGVEAGIKLSDFEPDLILMDIMMPGMDGYKAIKYLNAGKERTGRDVKVIVVTALVSEGLLTDLKKMGIKYMNKPVDSRKLMKMIREELGEKES